MSTAAHAIWVVMCTRAKWSTNARDFRSTRTWPCAWRLTREEALDLCERLTAHARAQREASAHADWPAEYWPTFDVLRVTEEVDQAALADAFDRTEVGTGEVRASGAGGVAPGLLGQLQDNRDRLVSLLGGVASSAQPDRKRSATPACSCRLTGLNRGCPVHDEPGT